MFKRLVPNMSPEDRSILSKIQRGVRLIPSTFSLRTIRGKLLASPILIIMSFILVSSIYNIGTTKLFKNIAYGSFIESAEFTRQAIENYLSGIEKASNTIASSTTIQQHLFTNDPVVRIITDKPVTELLRVVVENNTNIQNVVLLTKSGRKISYNFFGMNEVLGFIENIRYDSIKGNEPFYSEIQRIDTDGQMYISTFCLTPIYNVLPENITKEKLGICVAICDIRKLTKGIIYKPPEAGIVALIHHNTIISTNKELNENEREMLLSSRSETGQRVIDGETFLTNSIPLTRLSLRFAMLYPMEAFTKRLVTLTRISLFVIAAAVVIVFALMYLITNAIATPVRKLIGGIEQIEKFGLSHRIDLSKDKDIAFIGTRINTMLDKISEYHTMAVDSQERAYKATIEHHKAMLLYYQSQVNPHFLFNTIECIRSMAQEYKVVCIEELCGAMARMFRYSLRAEPIVTLETEIKYTLDYLKVMSFRRADGIDVRICLPEELKTFTIPTMTIQPIVENSILHGFKNKDAECSIRISARRCSEDAFFLHVADNGCGIDRFFLKELNKKLCNTDDSLGVEGRDALLNIKNRLCLSIGPECRVRVRSDGESATVVGLYIRKG